MIEKIKVGQKWLTRNGQTAEILAIDEGTWPIYVKVNDYQYYYGVKGNFSDAGIENERDLVTLVEELEMKTIEVGQKWKTRDGVGVATIRSVSLDMRLNYPIIAAVELVEMEAFPRILSYTTDGFYYSNDFHSHDPMDLLELILEDKVTALDTQFYGEIPEKEESKAVEEDAFISQEHLWAHLLSDGLIQSKDNKQVFGFDNGYIRAFIEKDKAESFVSTLNFTIIDHWTKYTFPEKEVWKPRKPTLCWVTDSEIANPCYEVEFISDYDEELYINTDECRTWKYAIPLTIDEVAVYLDECE